MGIDTKKMFDASLLCLLALCLAVCSAYQTPFVICGTEKCKNCYSDGCADQDNDGLDRDMHKDDLHCPNGYGTYEFRKYPQIIGYDVYLKICQKRDNFGDEA